MHIGFLTSEFPHRRATRSAGIGSSIKTTAKALVAAGVEVSIFVYGQREDSIFEEDGIDIHLIKQRLYKSLGWYQYRKFLQKYLNNLITLNNIHVIEAPDWTGVTSFMKLDCPLVIRMHGSDAYFCHLEGRPQKMKNFWFEKMALQNADSLISVSRYTAQKTAEIFSLKKEATVIPNSVEVEEFKPRSEKINSNQLLYFGSIIRKKGVLELAHIFNELHTEKPQATLLLVGKDVQDIFEKISTLELFWSRLSITAKERVTYVPEVTREEIKEYINSSAVVVFPSFAEAFPMAWLEAMSMEKPLVTSNIGWAQELMLDGSTGFTVNPSDHRAYAVRISELLENPEKARTMGRAARQRIVDNFSSQSVTHSNLEFYTRLTGSYP